MYTELHMSARIKDDPEAVAILKYMAGQTDEQPPLPDHPLFATPRWSALFRCSSYYFVPRSTVLFERDEIGGYWCLISQASIKNYDGEIGKFIDWIRPYVDDTDTMIGYSRYEEDREPTIYYS
jgi:hypothetical protein